MAIATASAWNEKGNATDGNATATRAAETGNAHYVTDIVASFDATATADLTIKDGSTTIATVTVYDSLHLHFGRGLRMSAGNKAEVVLAAGGTGVDGNVFLAGFTASS